MKTLSFVIVCSFILIFLVPLLLLPKGRRISYEFLDLNKNHEILSLHSAVEHSADSQQKLYPRVMNTLLTDYYPDIAERFQKTVDQNLPADHPSVVSLARDMMDPPVYARQYKTSLHVKHTPQSQRVLQYFTQTRTHRNGFFIECGALDGERSSNTLVLEYSYNWTGLLIEADPYFYTQLRGKRRRAWSINACLSPTNNTMWADFSGDENGKGKVLNDDGSEITALSDLKVPCFPLETLLLALQRQHVDYFSLDVEGLEIPIIESIPHNKVNIHVWTIEFPKEDPESLTRAMTKYRYKRAGVIHGTGGGLEGYARDFMFIKESS